MTPDMLYGYLMVFGPPVLLTYCAVLLTLIYRRLGKPTMLGVAVIDRTGGKNEPR